MATISRNEYKITLLLLKYLPMIVLILTMLAATLVHFEIALPLYIFCSPSIFSLIMTVLLSKLFKFCYVHRLPVYWMIIGKFLLMFTGESILDLMPLAYTMLIIGGVACILYTLLHLLFGNKIRRKLGIEEDLNIVI